MLFDPHRLGVHKVLQHVPLNALLDRPFQAAVQRAVNIADLRKIASRRAHKMVFDYMDGGCDDEISLRRNHDAFTMLELHYGVLNGLQPPLDLSTTLFGKQVQLPFFTCPTAGNQMFHYEGERAVAEVANDYGALYSLSSLSTESIPTIAKAHSADLPKVFQLYVWKDREIVRDVLHQAKEYGFNALALTVDVSWMGNRERDPRNGFTVPPTYTLRQTWEALRSPAWTMDFLSREPYQYACFNKDVPAASMAAFIGSQLSPDFDWKDAEWLLGEWTHGPVAIKGVVRPEDAITAKATGFSTIWVSNHGGRQLETSPATIDVLPSIRAAVGSDTEIILDGGIHRGTDILKALALGADGVGLGRAYLWGLTAGGKAGVEKTYQILRQELDRAMGLLGVGTVSELKKLGPGMVRRRDASIRDHPDRHAYERGYGGGYI